MSAVTADIPGTDQLAGLFMYRRPGLHTVVTLSMAAITAVADCEQLARIPLLMFLFRIALGAAIVTAISYFPGDKAGTLRMSAFDQ